jgi:3-hydroxybutyryl-CoA dehydrogenase
MITNTEPGKLRIGVVGLGLMGSSIVVALAISDHPIIAIAPIKQDLEYAHNYLSEEISHCASAGILVQSPEYYLSRITISEDYADLCDCAIVFECVVEDLEIKKRVYQNIQQSVPVTTIIASNTSALPISLLQSFVKNPERFLGIHWAEPAYMSRFLEITCGDLTKKENAEWVYKLAHCWKKEPTLLAKDIRGFITNRLMYALYREALHLSESTGISLQDLDKCLKYDAGSWMTFMGILRRMDFYGLNDYYTIAKNLFPKLSNSNQIPKTMQEVLIKDFRGTKNGKGLYEYQDGDAQKWEHSFSQYNKDIYLLADDFPYGVIQKHLDDNGF